MLYRPLADTGLKISEIALGCWPMAGMTSPGTSDAESMATIEACFELGINHLDTAYMYGLAGESERLIGRTLGPRRDEMVIATKCGLHWDRDGKQAHDARPATLRQQCEESLRRLGTDRVELLYLHAPDENVPVRESAGELKRLMAEGKTRAVGVSNVTLAQLEEFAAECLPAVYQPPYNMLMRQIEADTLPWCRERGVAVLVYWPLMKGLLAGKIARDYVFGPDDSRHKYPMFLGEERRKNHDLVDRLREVARDRCRRRLQSPIVLRTSGTSATGVASHKRPTWPQRGGTGDQLDGPSAGHYRRALRRQAAGANSRVRRRERLATHRRTTRRDRTHHPGTRAGRRAVAGVTT